MLKKKDGEKHQSSVTASCPLPTIQQDIIIPCALRGGQKKETKAQAVPVKRRLTVKTTDIGGKDAGKAAKMSPKLSGPCKVIKRVKDAKGYILDKKKMYVCSASESMNGPFYMKALEILAKEIDEGMVATIEVARVRIAELTQAEDV